MWMMSPPFHLVYLIPPLLATTKRDHLVPPAGNRQRRKGCIRTHTHTYTHIYTHTYTRLLCFYRRRGQGALRTVEITSGS